MTHTQPIHAVAIYDVEEHYGGPEEGGWWYGNGPLEEVRGWYHGEDVANNLAYELNQRFREESGGRRARKVATVVAIPRTEDVHVNERCAPGPARGPAPAWSWCSPPLVPTIGTAHGPLAGARRAAYGQQ